MQPRTPTLADLEQWPGATIIDMRGDHVGAENIKVIRDPHDGVPLIRVPWVLDERDNVSVESPLREEGMTVWTTFWGGTMVPTDVVIQ